MIFIYSLYLFFIVDFYLFFTFVFLFRCLICYDVRMCCLYVRRARLADWLFFFSLIFLG